MKKILLLLITCITFSQVSGLFASPNRNDVTYYFKTTDGIYYCTDIFKESFDLCNNLGFDISQETEGKVMRADGKNYITVLNQFGIIDEKSGWVSFKKQVAEDNAKSIEDGLICINGKGIITNNCEISYIAMLDGGYICNFINFEVDCSDIPRYISMQSGIPESVGTFLVKKSTQIGTKEYKGKEVTIKDGKEIQVASGETIQTFSQKTGSSILENGNCIVNGEKVDCAQVAKDVGGFLKMGLWAILGFAILCLVSFVFWLMMLIHACSNNIPNKVLWIVLLVGIGFIGGGLIIAIVYYFVVKRHCTTNYIPPANTQPYQASVTVGYQEGPVATTPVVVVAPVPPVPPAPPTTPPVNPITPIITTPVSTMPPTTPPSPTIPTAAATTQTVESMIATSGAGTMSQAPLGSSSSVTPTVPPFDQNNTPLQNPPSTNI